MIHKSYNDYVETELNEGWKDWTIGASLLIASILNPSKLDAQVKSVADKDKTITSIENVTKNPVELDKVANFLSSKGFGNANAIKGTITKNANDLKSKIEKGDQIATVKTTSPEQAVKYMRQGYCFTQVEIDTLISDTYKDVEEISLDSVHINGHSEDFFDFSSIVLKDNIKSDLKIIADSIINSGSKITNIRIASGTDKVRIDPNGDLFKQGVQNNKDLAETRATVIKDYLGSIGIDTNMITICTYPNNVENVQGFQPDEKLRIAKVEILSLRAPDHLAEPVKPSGKVETNANFELVKSIEKVKTTITTKKLHLETKKLNSVSKKLIGKKIKCAKWN